jgi:hypothetical protein
MYKHYWRKCVTQSKEIFVLDLWVHLTVNTELVSHLEEDHVSDTENYHNVHIVTEHKQWE